ncbi:tetratricopeptide repeat protein [Algisphaera agarilytica]|uniref:Tetratricopeptide (TPR) repeat protein n=1 Tax=Algisphaera agarilytica TaxID=1385975 RepID=A0A7X0LL66_9BACT|nr:tetratricopeptide repeat protein [Algisphaera agarilytica]MBB6430574.1 tetratricopeptide (TPR) repeat protein [Algisphaera agarilytica]
MHERIDDATALVQEHYTSGENEVSLPWGLMETLQKAGAVQPLFEFTEKMIDTEVGDAFWSVYIELGAQLEQSDRVLAKVEQALENAEGQQRVDLLDQLIDARFAAGEVEQGVESLREKIKIAQENPSSDSNNTLNAYVQLAKIGWLMQREDWLDEGLEQALAELAKAPDPEGNDRWYRASARQQAVGVLMKAERFAEVEKLLIDGVSDAVRNHEQESRGGYGGDVDSIRDAMVEVAVFYGEVERWADVRLMLEKSPYWGTSDLKEILTQKGASGSSPLAVYVASALADNGQSQDALAMVNHALDQEPGEDSLYALLAELDPNGAPARLDELFARDQFEERPLIWKAKLALDAGDVDAADQIIRQAISIDPSDGEQGAGDRMRAYAILAEVLRAQGDDDTAEIMEGAVRAIRISEDADEFDRAGLLSHGVTGYKEALTHFADAYCIQSRLAIQLANLGRYDEAAEHYQRAFELMPSSFGRVESHCFGCEDAFSGERAQTIAARVFDELVIAQPLTPQVHYLRGYLYTSMNKHQDALANYQQATTLDPDYLNAWKRIQGLARHMQLEQEKQDEAALAIFRLDPLGRHASSDLSTVSDLAAAWRAMEAAQPLRIEPPESVLVLPASAAWIEENTTSDDFRWRYRYNSREQLETPGGFLASHGITNLASTVATLGMH